VRTSGGIVYFWYKRTWDFTLNAIIIFKIHKFSAILQKSKVVTHIVLFTKAWTIRKCMFPASNIKLSSSCTKWWLGQPSKMFKVETNGTFVLSRFFTSEIFARSDLFPLSVSLITSASYRDVAKWMPAKEKGRFAQKNSLVENRLKTLKHLLFSGL
jgi:hypothetical protein